MAIATAALGQETTSYAYDALGRLTGSVISGGPNAARTTNSCFDPAGNRVRYDVATSAAAPCSMPVPTPTPTPTNYPPIAVDDSATAQRCTETVVNVTGNDSDPDGDAFALIAVTSGTHGSASVMDDDNVDFFAGSSLGTDVLTYTIRDSHGATATGTLNVRVQGACENFGARPPETGEAQ